MTIRIVITWSGDEGITRFSKEYGIQDRILKLDMLSDAIAALKQEHARVLEESRDENPVGTALLFGVGATAQGYEPVS